MSLFKPLVCALLALSCFLLSLAHADEATVRPNVVLIVADDMGYSDIGAFGSEIATPHLDTLAASGVKLTNFHAAPTCSPTRSMLLTGTDNHTAGVGAMAEVPRPELAGRYGYEGKITDRVATIAERFRAAGYSTIMTGKWHLGMTEESIPSSRGFDKSFALLQGGHNHYGNSGFGQASEGPMAATYMDDGVRVDVPTSFYSSDYFTTKLAEKIDAAGADKPFFVFLSFTAPHSPLQAPKSLVRKYQGKYDAGWAQIRAERVARMKAMGLIGDNAVFDDMEPMPQSWETLNGEERRIAARNMEVYAAMIERLDWNVGQLRKHLKASGRDENTIFLFISDNGPAGHVAKDYMVVPSVQERLKSANNAMGNRGGPTSYVFYGPHWASAGSAPFRLHKGFVTDGGTRVPAIISGAGIERGGEQSAARATVMDVVPTLLELTGIESTNRVDGREVAAIRGRSMVPVLKGEAEVVHPADEAISFELHGQRTVVRGDWKLLFMPAPIGTGSWQLFDLASDPAERHDVSGQHPEIVAQLSDAWDSYAAETHVIVAPAH